MHATTYTVVAHFPDSGGIYQGGEVSYRGVKVGQVGKLELTSSGVDVYLDIDKSQATIPSKTLAVVGNRSAVGEQYVELQPQTKSGPYLKDGSTIAQSDTEIPIATDKLLGDVSTTVDSVDQQALQTTLTELGTAFAGTGQELQTILDTGSAFVTTADQNFDVTTALLKDGNKVLKTQSDTEGAIRSFSRDLSLVTDTLTASNHDLVKCSRTARPARPSCASSSTATASTSARSSPRRSPPARSSTSTSRPALRAGRLPLRHRGRLLGAGEGLRRHLERPLRPDPHDPAGLSRRV